MNKAAFENLAADYNEDQNLNEDEMKMFKDRKYSMVSNEVQK